MDRSACKAIVDREIEPLMRRLGVPHWKVTVSYDPKEADGGWLNRGLVDYHVDYNRATININPDAYDDGDEETVLGTLRHELMHLVVSPFCVFRNAVAAAFRADDVAWQVMESVFQHAQEKAVINLERMFSGLTSVEDVPAADPPYGTSVNVRVESVFPAADIADASVYAKDREDVAYLITPRERLPGVGDRITIFKDKDAGRWTY